MVEKRNGLSQEAMEIVVEIIGIVIEWKNQKLSSNASMNRIFHVISSRGLDEKTGQTTSNNKLYFSAILKTGAKSTGRP